MTYRPPDQPFKVVKRIRLPILKSMRRWPDPSPEDVSALWEAMCTHFNVSILDKASSEEMQAAANAADALGIVDRERFLRDFVTTIGNRIYTPFEPGVPKPPWDLWQQTMVIGHEVAHVLRDRSMEGILFEYQYASNSTKRAYYEMEAYRVNMTLTWIFRYEELSPLALASLLNDYACDMADVTMVAKMLGQSLIAIKKGAIPNEACRFETDWLKARWS